MSGGLRPLCEELLHFAKRPLLAVTDATQEVEPDHKPTGLWVSVGAAWAEWCVGESFATDRLVTVTRVLLTEDANILRLGSASELDSFTQQYGKVPEWATTDWARRRFDIQWADVAAEYDGIIIAPYVWSRRHELQWYYGWDVASGCIWNARAVASLESISLAPSND